MPTDLVKSSGSLNPLTEIEKEAPTPGWHFCLFCFVYIYYFWGEPGGAGHFVYASTSARDPPMSVCGGWCACVCQVCVRVHGNL